METRRNVLIDNNKLGLQLCLVKYILVAANLQEQYEALDNFMLVKGQSTGFTQVKCSFFSPGWTVIDSTVAWDQLNRLNTSSLCQPTTFFQTSQQKINCKILDATLLLFFFFFKSHLKLPVYLSADRSASACTVVSMASSSSRPGFVVFGVRAWTTEEESKR